MNKMGKEIDPYHPIWPDSAQVTSLVNSKTNKRNTIEKLLKKNPKCFYCRQKLNLNTAIIDDIGMHVLSCITCKKERGDMSVDEYLEWRLIRWQENLIKESELTMQKFFAKKKSWFDVIINILEKVDSNFDLVCQTVKEK